MEILKPNFINTTTQLTITSGAGATGTGSATVSYIFNRDKIFQYQTSGMNNDNTAASVTVVFDSTQTISRIALLEHNLKQFKVFYNGLTANVFALTTTGATTSSDFSTNSETSMYLRCTPTFCTSVTLEMKATIVSNAEKAVGEFILSDIRLDFSRIPSADGYKPLLDPIDVVHTLSDGGTRIHVIQDKRSAELSMDNITQTFRDQLKTIHELYDSHIFCPFGTTTGWDEFIFECVWTGPFDFYKYSDDASSAGFSGRIRLKEV